MSAPLIKINNNCEKTILCMDTPCDGIKTLNLIDWLLSA